MSGGTAEFNPHKSFGLFWSSDLSQECHRLEYKYRDDSNTEYILGYAESEYGGLYKVEISEKASEILKKVRGKRMIPDPWETEIDVAAKCCIEQWISEVLWENYKTGKYKGDSLVKSIGVKL